jgi:micrococcal nuclease
VIAAALLILPLAALAASAPVTRVIDGDTLVVRQGKRSIHLRVANVDAPELSQPGGNAARDHTAALCADQVATYTVRAIDRYHRSVADVTCAGQDVARSLRENGHIKPARR